LDYTPGFDDWEFDTSSERLSAGGREVALRPKVFALLAFLARHPGRLVSREELLSAVWPDVRVSNTTLATTVWEVRAALAGYAGTRARVRTVHGRGYRFDTPTGSTRPIGQGPVQGGGTTGFAAFVGRRRVLDRIQTALDAARQGSGRAFFLVGETGIGKSHLLLEAARRSRAQAHAAHVAACIVADDVPAAWPWVQLLRSLLASVPKARRPGLERRYAAAFELVPERKRPSRSAPGARTPAAPLPFATRDAFTALLHESAREKPQVLILDDLQQADASTLQLLLHVACTLGGSAVTLLGAARSQPVSSPLLESVFAVLGGTASISSLAGLDPPETAELIARVTGAQPATAVSLLVHRRTGGVPYLVVELAHALAEAEALDDVELARGVAPLVLQRWERARLAALGPATNRLLECAARLGETVRAADLRARCADLDPEDRERGSARALQLGVIAPAGRVAQHRYLRASSREVLHAALR
jgi:DNA-binding winged helix-turn-helix (wHTH) protein/predicted ATPase